MLKKENRYRDIIVLLFIVKIICYYVAMNIKVWQNFSWIVTIGIFLIIMYLCRHSRRSNPRKRFVIMYFLFSLVLFIDIIYYGYFNQIVSINQLWQIKNISGSEDSVKAAIPFFSLLMLVDVPLIWYLMKKEAKTMIDIQPVTGKKSHVISLSLILGIILLACNPMGLGVVKKVNATEAVTAHAKDIIDNTIVRGLYGNKALGEIYVKEEIPESVAVAAVGEVIPEEVKKSEDEISAKIYHGVAEGRNLIVIQMESFQNFVIGKSYNGQELTPNLNKLIESDTLYFDRYYTNIGKGNTSDAEFSTITGLYPTIDGAAFDMYNENTYNGLPRLMKNAGYYTSSAIGMDKNFYNRNTAYVYQGYDTFFNSDTFDMDELSGMGLTDKSMFRQMVTNYKSMDQPFYSFILTLTNHYAYTLSEGIDAQMIDIAPEDEGTLFGGYMQTIHYTDEAIGQFIEELKSEGLYENSIIVMYGDHHGLNCSDKINYEKMSDYLGYSYDYDTMLNIPLIVHIPGSGITETIHTVGGQVDFLATIANLMKLDLSNTVTLGQDIVNADEGYMATVAYMFKGSFIKDDVLYEIGRDGTFKSGRAIDLNTHEAIPIDGLEDESKLATAYLELSKYILEHNLAVGTSTIDELLQMEQEDMMKKETES